MQQHQPLTALYTQFMIRKVSLGFVFPSNDSSAQLKRERELVDVHPSTSQTTHPMTKPLFLSFAECEDRLVAMLPRRVPLPRARGET